MKTSAYLLTNKSECITSDFYFSKDKSLNYYSLNDNRWQSSLIIDVDIKDGYEYDTNTNTCYLVAKEPFMSSLGMTQANYNFLMGLSGVLIGFTLLIGFVLHFTRR